MGLHRQDFGPEATPFQPFGQSDDIPQIAVHVQVAGIEVGDAQ
jgi:hypothetical protein